MTLYREAQANPEEPIDLELADMQQRIEHTVKALEKNSRAITWWFFKGLLAFNLILGSLVMWFAVLSLLH